VEDERGAGGFETFEGCIRESVGKKMENLFYE
jgi:molybdopterin synthase catalytic subunit